MKPKREPSAPSAPKTITPARAPELAPTPAATPIIESEAPPRPSRKKRILGGGKSMTQMLSRHAKVVGVEEYDLRGIQDSRELRLVTEYEYAREAVRWCLDYLTLAGEGTKANALQLLLRSKPILASLPRGKVDADDLDHLSDMLLFWRNCAASADTPPAAMTMIKRLRKYAAAAHHQGPAKVFRLRDKTFAKNRLGDKFSTTFVVHVLKHPKRKASAREVADALYKVTVAEGVCVDDEGGRPKSDLLALVYLRVCKGMREPKAHLYFREHLRPGDEGATVFGSEIYAAALGKKGPSKGAWSEGLKRAHKRIVRLAELFMRMVDEGHVIATS